MRKINVYACTAILGLFVMALLSSAAMAQAKININTASAERLRELHGVGPKRAAAIIEYREKHGPFETVDDLVKVHGIGSKYLEQWRPMIYVGRVGRRGGAVPQEKPQKKKGKKIKKVRKIRKIRTIPKADSESE